MNRAYGFFRTIKVTRERNAIATDAKEKLYIRRKRTSYGKGGENDGKTGSSRHWNMFQKD